MEPIYEDRGDRLPKGSDGEAAADEDEARVPERVAEFVQSLQDYVVARNIAGIESLYDQQYKLSDRFFKTTSWPTIDQVREKLEEAQGESVDDAKLYNKVAEMLYNDLYYRHIYSRLTPTFEQRVGAWQNYTRMLTHFVEEMDARRPLDLPPQWMWDILDEFIYQFQNYSTFRNKAIKSDRTEDVDAMKAHPDIWNTVQVFKLLHQLKNKSNVHAYLASLQASDACPLDVTPQTLLGFFAMVELLRLESLFGDYRSALRVIEQVPSTTCPLYVTVPACYTSLFYYKGFAYLMLRRHRDAVSTFSTILLHLSRARHYSLSYQQDDIAKKIEQMYALMRLANALCPGHIDESLLQNDKENQKQLEKQAKLNRGEEIVFEELFSYSCPKFISPPPADIEKLEEFNPNEAHQRQLKLFLQEVQQQQKFPELRAYMRLYSAMPLEKLSKFVELDQVPAVALQLLREQLLCYKHKSRQLVHSDGAALTGTSCNCSDIAFAIQGDMMHMKAQEQRKDYTDIFLQQMDKFKGIVHTIEASI